MKNVNVTKATNINLAVNIRSFNKVQRVKLIPFIPRNFFPFFGKDAE